MWKTEKRRSGRFSVFRSSWAALRAKARPSSSSASKTRVTSVGWRIASGEEALAGAPGAPGTAAAGAGPLSTNRKLTMALGWPSSRTSISSARRSPTVRPFLSHATMSRTTAWAPVEKTGGTSGPGACGGEATGAGRGQEGRESHRDRPPRAQRVVLPGYFFCRAASSDFATSTFGVPAGAAAMNFSSRAMASGLSFMLRATVARWYWVSRFCGSSCSALRKACFAVAASPPPSASTPSAYCRRPALLVRGGAPPARP